MEDQPNAAVVTWSGDRSHFTAAMPYGHTIEVDEPEPVGANQGPRPTDLLLAAVASCSGISAQMILAKMRQPVTALTVRASGTRDPEWPKAYTRISLDFEVTLGPGFHLDLVEKAVDRAVKKYCPVSATVESGVGGTQIDYKITTLEAL